LATVEDSATRRAELLAASYEAEAYRVTAAD
jgi:hypothetical protein